MNTTTNDSNETPAAPVVQKWQTGEGLGPRMAKVFNEALKKASWNARGTKELRGIHGRPETQRDDGCIMVQLGGGAIHPEYAAKMVAIQTKHGITVTPANYKAVAEDLTELARWFTANPMIKDLRITQAEHDQREADRVARDAKQNQERMEHDKAAAELRAKIEAVKPVWAEALVVAFYEVDDCELQSDYFNTKTQRAIVLGFRSGSREDFRQLRALAASQPETADLDCDEAEHRDNYSMGRGNYLKKSGRYSTGWCIKSVAITLDGYAFTQLAGMPCELRAKQDTTPANAFGQAPAAGSGGVTVSLNKEKGGVEIRFPAKPDDSTILSVKSAGFRWSKFSRCWWAKDRSYTRGFAYKLAGVAEPTPAAATTETVRDPGEEAADRWNETQPQLA